MNGTVNTTFQVGISTNNGFVNGDNSGTYTLAGCFGCSDSTYYLQSQNGYRDLGSGVNVSTTDDKNIIRLNLVKGAVIDNKTIYPMLIKGNYVNNVSEFIPHKETIKYNIYLDEPLRKVGSSSDYIDFNTSKLVKKVADVDLSATYRKFTGVPSNVGIYKKLTNTVRFGNHFISLGLKNSIKKSGMLSNILPYRSDWTYDGEIIFEHPDLTTHFYMSFNKSRLGITSESTDDEIKALMSDYVKNNNIMIYYELGSSENSDIELPNIDIDANSIVTIGTDIPATVEVDYNE